MSLIKFYLNKFDKQLSFQIVEQAEHTRNTDTQSSGFRFVAPNGIEICSCAYPRIIRDQLHPNIKIFLRGSSGGVDDLRIAPIDFDTNKGRDIMYDRILEALGEWANRGGFVPTAPQFVNYDGLFEF